MILCVIVWTLECFVVVFFHGFVSDPPHQESRLHLWPQEPAEIPKVRTLTDPPCRHSIISPTVGKVATSSQVLMNGTLEIELRSRLSWDRAGQLDEETSYLLLLLLLLSLSVKMEAALLLPLLLLLHLLGFSTSHSEGNALRDCRTRQALVPWSCMHCFVFFFIKTK